jgi:hypothetical protein
MNDMMPVSAGREVQRIEDTLPQQIQYAAISASNSGDNTLVTAVSGKKIKVQSYVIVAVGTVSVTFKSNSTSLSGAMPLVVNSGIAAAPTKPTAGSWFQTASGEALVLNLSDAIAVTGHFSYYLE